MNFRGQHGKKQEELAQELQGHLQMAVSERIERGESVTEAAQSARREFGNVDLVQQVTRDQWGWLWLEELLKDLRHRARMLPENPAFPPGAFATRRSQIQSMDVAAYVEGYEFNLTAKGAPVRLTVTLVSADLFSVLDAPAETGRTFRAGEDLATQNNYVVLSHHLWQQRFASDASVIGQWINLEGVPRQIVGVMAAGFRFSPPLTDVGIPFNLGLPRPVHFWAGGFFPLLLP